MSEIELLRGEIEKREAELSTLKSKLAALESQEASKEGEGQDKNEPNWKWPLSAEEYSRYSRQMMVPKFGIQGQQRVKKARVLLVGAGGLGCPAAAYLAGAGVGEIGFVDGDSVEVSNLHRQIAHSTSRVGMSKVDSAITYLRSINPTITYRAHKTNLTPHNAAGIVSHYDYVLDCTDRPASRYLVSDICVLLGKPLISASAFQSSGQLIILNNPPGKGPCYRCIFPKPPPPETVVGCGEGGILGPVVGVMGVLQALEAIKVIIASDEEKSQQQHMMLLFSGMGDTPFRSVKMRGQRKGCFACSILDVAQKTPGLDLEYMDTSMDYDQFCGVPAPVRILSAEERITAAEYDKAKRAGRDHIMLDVREKEHFDMCHIEGSVNIPISRFMSPRATTSGYELPDWLPFDIQAEYPIYLVCRVGNDSQIAAQKLKDMGLDRGGERFIGDIQGGLKAWKVAVDPSMPFV